MKFRLILLIIIILWKLNAYSQNEFTLDTSLSFQTIRGFGASDAWSNDVLNMMKSEDRRTAADWLFSRKQMPDGSYCGIGLSIWRYNLGAGSSEQGDSSCIGDPFRRTESFLLSDGNYDFTKQSGTQWMIREASRLGTENLIMFTNSPPVNFTKNNKAFSGECGKSNIDPDKYKAFSAYISRSLQHFHDQGIQIDYVSPVNEPEWGWCRKDGQEGCPYTNDELASLVRELNAELATKNINTRIQIPESGLLIYANNGHRFKPGRQHQTKDFFRQKGANYIGKESLIAHQIAAHSYFTEWPPFVMKSVRKKTARTTERYDLEYWMTEYCILRETKEISGGGRDTGMNTALYVSRVIHHDLVFGNASAWCWWLGLSAYDFKDGLVYVNRDGSGLTDSKTMWALGNFSQFIRPGSVRLNVKGKYDRELMVSAYKDNDSDNIIIVIINMKNTEQELKFNNLPRGTYSLWETSEDSNLKNLKPDMEGNSLKVKAESISTIVLDLTD